jgi:hypothetical protein
MITTQRLIFQVDLAAEELIIKMAGPATETQATTQCLTKGIMVVEHLLMVVNTVGVAAVVLERQEGKKRLDLEVVLAAVVLDMLVLVVLEKHQQLLDHR